MKEIIKGVQGIFIRYGAPSRNGIFSDSYNLTFIGSENDKKNIRGDVANLLGDFCVSVNEAKMKLNI
ncbi:hypothetical protein AGMMS49982_09970 [Bacteroidia bacterium]|nr:hypothetical protein AGMMS49982_09970 [Bacteroidia bacterium]